MGKIFGQLKLVAFVLLICFLAAFHSQLACVPSIVGTYAQWALILAGAKSIPTVKAGINSSNLPDRIPRTIHQTWKDESIPPRWEKAVASCREMYPDYEYMWWTDVSGREFVAEHYPWFLPTFDAYPNNIQRADVIRYFILLKFGGIYIDLDVGCVRRLDDQLHHQVVLPLTRPLGFSNEFMMAAPGTAFMAQLVERLPAWANNFGFHYGTVMFSTGPMFVTVQHAVSPHKREVVALPDMLYGKFSNHTDRYLTHYPGSSWHSSDSAVIFWLYGHLMSLLRLGVIATLVVLISCMSFRLQKAVCATKVKVSEQAVAAESKCMV